MKMHGVVWGPGGTRVRTSESYWKQPEKWNRAHYRCLSCGMFCQYVKADNRGARMSSCCAAGVSECRPRVFCASLGDVFEGWDGPMVDHNSCQIFTCMNACGLLTTFRPVSSKCAKCDDELRPLTMDDCRRDLFRLIDQTPNLDWLLLTKRPENVIKMWPPIRWSRGRHGYHEPHLLRSNVWLGVSVSDQATADQAIPELLKLRDLSPCLFLSVEPLLGPVDLQNVRAPEDDNVGASRINALNGSRSDMGRPCPPVGQVWSGAPATPPHQTDWVIVGGESGPNARPCNVEWVRGVVRQCRDAGVPVHVKQLGAQPIINRMESWVGGPGLLEHGDCWKIHLKHPKGGAMEEWPEDVRVREFPQIGVGS